MGDAEDFVYREGVQQKFKLSKKQQVKLVIAYWFIGLCNNVGYVVALTAAHDLLHEITKGHEEDHSAIKDTFNRECNVISTGAILLADIIPSIFVKVIAPFFPLMIKIRFIIVIGLNVAGFLMCAFGFQSLETSWIGICGVINISLSSGLGESSALAYTSFFPTRNALAAWSSGTGGAGVIGATMYATLRQVGLSSRGSMIVMLMWPIIEIIAFYVILPHPRIMRQKVSLRKLEASNKEQKDAIPLIEDPHSFKAKLLIIKKIFLIYSVPFCLTYFFEYFINQALFELLYYPNDIMDHSSQYRWYQSAYQLGVFTSRSSIILFRIPYIYLLALIQFLNAFILTLEVLYGFLYFTLVCIVACYWEGLVAGASYVNTYHRISTEQPPLQREFSMAINSVGDAVAITLAGIVAIPTHRLLCTSKNPYVERMKK